MHDLNFLDKSIKSGTQKLFWFGFKKKQRKKVGFC